MYINISSARLPDTIDSTVAIAAFVSQRKWLLESIRFSLPKLANDLYTRSLIPLDVYTKCCNEKTDEINVRGLHLLDCVEVGIRRYPQDFKEFITILEDSGPYYAKSAHELVKSYCKLIDRHEILGV